MRGVRSSWTTCFAVTSSTSDPAHPLPGVHVPRYAAAVGPDPVLPPVLPRSLVGQEFQFVNPQRMLSFSAKGRHKFCRSCVLRVIEETLPQRIF